MSRYGNTAFNEENLISRSGENSWVVVHEDRFVKLGERTMA